MAGIFFKWRVVRGTTGHLPPLLPLLRCSTKVSFSKPENVGSAGLWNCACQLASCRHGVITTVCHEVRVTGISSLHRWSTGHARQSRCSGWLGLSAWQVCQPPKPAASGEHLAGKVPKHAPLAGHVVELQRLHVPHVREGLHRSERVGLQLPADRHDDQREVRVRGRQRARQPLPPR